MQRFWDGPPVPGWSDEGRLIPPHMSTNVSRQTIVMVY